MRQRARRFVSITILSLFCVLQGSAQALTDAQRQAFSQGIGYTTTEDSTSCSNGSNVTVPAGNLPSYIPEPYNGDFTAAGKAYNVSPILIAAIFSEEHFTNQPASNMPGNWQRLPKVQPDPNSGWATSADQAMGPFQFIPSTWKSLGVDADHNGVKDPENLLDASFAAANYMATDKAFATAPKSVWVAFADGYSGHTGGYADHVSQYIDFYASGQTSTTSSTDAAASALVSTTSTSDCGSSAPGPIAGNIVQTAVNFAWDDYPSGHGFEAKGAAEAKPAYVTAVAQYNSGVNSSDYTDCGVYVATVLRAAGIDANFPGSGTSSQLAYVNKHPEKYTVKQPGQWAVSDVQPGDIFLTDGHGYIYVGPQSNKYSVAQASQTDHVPEINAYPYTQQTMGGSVEKFSLVRVNN